MIGKSNIFIFLVLSENHLLFFRQGSEKQTHCSRWDLKSLFCGHIFWCQIPLKVLMWNIFVFSEKSPLNNSLSVSSETEELTNRWIHNWETQLWKNWHFVESAILSNVFAQQKKPLSQDFLGPRGPLVLPLIGPVRPVPSVRAKNLDPMYTGIYASWIIRRLLKPTRWPNGIP